MTLLASLGWTSLVTVGLGPAAGAAEAPAAGAGSDLHADVAAAGHLAAQINAERTSHGLQPLAIHRELTDLAQAHSRRMAAAGKIWHDDALFSDDMRTRLGAKVLGENVGADGRDGTVDLHQMYMDSPPHRANVLDPRFTMMGIGVTVVDGVAYSTEDFMQAAPAPVHRPSPPPPAVTSTPSPPPAAPVVRAVASSAPAAATAGEAVATVTPRPMATIAATETQWQVRGEPMVASLSTSVEDPMLVAAVLGAANGLLALAGLGLGRRTLRVAGA